MAKKKTEYAVSPYEPYEYVIAWMAATGEREINPVLFEMWIRSIRFDGLPLSRQFIREVYFTYHTQTEGKDLYGLALQFYYNDKLRIHQMFKNSMEKTDND